MTPQFVRPENPVSFAGPGELMRFLDQHNVNYQAWMPGRFDDLWKEIVSTDTLITTGLIRNTDTTAVFRNIRTVTLRITFEKYVESAPLNQRVMVLAEYRIGKNCELTPRDHPQSSVTEKMHWNEPGYEERRAAAIVRVLQEELDIAVSHENLQFDVNLFPVSASLRRRMTDFIQETNEERELGLNGFYLSEAAKLLESDIELDVRWSGKKKYPGIVVHNQLVHYWLKMHPDHYCEEGYIDSERRYQSIWVPSAEEHN